MSILKLCSLRWINHRLGPVYRISVTLVQVTNGTPRLLWQLFFLSVIVFYYTAEDLSCH